MLGSARVSCYPSSGLYAVMVVDKCVDDDDVDADTQRCYSSCCRRLVRDQGPSVLPTSTQPCWLVLQRRRLYSARQSWRRHYQVRFSSNEEAVSNGVDLTGLLGGHKGRLGVWGTEVPQRGPGQSPGRGSGGLRPPEAEAFFVKLHIIFALKYNKQQLLSLSPTS